MRFFNPRRGGRFSWFYAPPDIKSFLLIRNLQYNTYRPCHLISGDHTAVQWGTITYNRMCDYEPRFETCKLMKSLVATTSLFSFYQSGSVESLDLCFKRESKASIYVTVTRNLHQVIPNCSVSKQKQHSKTLYWFIIKIQMKSFHYFKLLLIVSFLAGYWYILIMTCFIFYVLIIK